MHTQYRFNQKQNTFSTQISMSFSRRPLVSTLALTIGELLISFKIRYSGNDKSKNSLSIVLVNYFLLLICS